MPKKKPTPMSPAAVSLAKKVKQKYSHGFQKSPSRAERAKKALLEVTEKGCKIKTMARKYGLRYGYLYQRATGKVDADSRNGPATMLSLEEENTIASFIREMALTGMGLGPSEVRDLVQNFLKKERRKTVFKDNRPGYSWYYSFIARHGLVFQKESPLETCRAKVTPQQLDEWFTKYRKFMSDRNLLDQPHRVWNADETGFTMGSKAGKVLAPRRQLHPAAIPHMSGGSIKSRFTVMYCANAEGHIMPPFFVFPNKKPSSYDPLIGAPRGSRAEYTEKGWMDVKTFSRFMDHFDEHAGVERPVILTIDSVSSHIDMDTFQKASSKQIEIYRLVPNSTHLMQPLDKGVFGPLKKSWYKIVNANTRENPGEPISKRNFAAKLAEAQMEFYKPSIVVNSFRATGIFLVNRDAMSDSTLKPSETFGTEDHLGQTDRSQTCTSTAKERERNAGAREAFEVFSSVLSTPQQRKYEERFEEGFDIENHSPSYNVYRKLKEKAFPSDSAGTPVSGKASTLQTLDVRPMSGLDLLASAALANETCRSPTMHTDQSIEVSPVLQDLVQLPHVSFRARSQRLLDRLPECLTSREGIREMALAKLKFARETAAKEKQAKQKYKAKQECDQKKLQKGKTVKDKSQNLKCKSMKSKNKNREELEGNTETCCSVCLGTEEEELAQGILMFWVQCDRCNEWMHRSCIPVNLVYNAAAFLPGSTVEFACHMCSL